MYLLLANLALVLELLIAFGGSPRRSPANTLQVVAGALVAPFMTIARGQWQVLYLQSAVCLKSVAASTRQKSDITRMHLTTAAELVVSDKRDPSQTPESKALTSASSNALYEYVNTFLYIQGFRSLRIHHRLARAENGNNNRNVAHSAILEETLPHHGECVSGSLIVWIWTARISNRLSGSQLQPRSCTAVMQASDDSQILHCSFCLPHRRQCKRRSIYSDCPRTTGVGSTPTLGA